ncbi:MAG: protein kinase, partial [Myxococcales bacterium]|nr:protein kinase [Myxococcales bacterium]
MRSSAGGSGPAQPQQRRFRYHETLAGKYRLEKSLARGGMGWVFLATQLPLGRQVAVKVLTPGQHDAQFRQRFLLEASTCAKLQHPNIVTIHDYGESERGDLFMAM